RRSAATVEAVSDGHGIVAALVRIFARARQDVRGDRHEARALVRPPLGRQEARAPQLPHAHPRANPLQEGASRQGEAPETVEEAPLRRQREPEGPALRPREVLSSLSGAYLKGPDAIVSGPVSGSRQ